MTRSEFSAWCSSVRLLDGATGSMLRTAGMPAGVCSESWILSHPQPLLELQRAYLAAGSDVVYAPTFGANRVLLSHHDLQKDVAALNRDLVQLSREAVGTGALLAGDMTTTGQPVTPGDDSAYADLLEIYREQAEALLCAGVDLFADFGCTGEFEPITECQGINAGLTPGSGDRFDPAMWDGVFFLSSSIAGWDNVTVRHIPAGLASQFINFPQIPDMLTDNGPIQLDVSATSSLPVTLELLQGPATLSGNTLTLTGEPGVVKVKRQSIRAMRLALI